MRILFLGDVVGRAGRAAIVNQLSDLRQAWKLDFVVVNAENATSGAGLNAAHAKAILEAGADCITLGDHAFDQKEMMTFIESEPRIIRPLNYAKSAPGRGARIFSDTRGRKILVAQVLGQVFMKRPFDDPFSRWIRFCGPIPWGDLCRQVWLTSTVKRHRKKWGWGISVMDGIRGRGHAYPCPNRGRNDFARWHRLSI